MAFDYSPLATKATDLIAEFGREVTLVELQKTPSDPTKPWRGDETPRVGPEQTVTASAVSVEPSSAVALGIAVEDSDFIKRAEEILIVAPAADDLEVFDEVVDGSTRWRVNEAQKLRPGAVTLLYFLSVRR